MVQRLSLEIVWPTGSPACAVAKADEWGSFVYWVDHDKMVKELTARAETAEAALAETATERELRAYRREKVALDQLSDLRESTSDEIGKLHDRVRDLNAQLSEDQVFFSDQQDSLFKPVS